MWGLGTIGQGRGSLLNGLDSARVGSACGLIDLNIKLDLQPTRQSELEGKTAEASRHLIPGPKPSCAFDGVQGKPDLRVLLLQST